MTKTEAIKKFLELKTHADLASLYCMEMETQVNVGSDSGELVEGEYNGHQWRGWTDGNTTWKNFRIPWKAYSDPEFTDSRMAFDLYEHAEGVGMTGWDWKNRCSRWVAYDFDAIVGHSEEHTKKLTDVELQAVKDKAAELPWITIRKSTSGSGLHLYVFLDNVPTANHHEHSALARAILGNMSALLGFDFETKVDICGGNMWVWHRKMLGTDGLTVIKQGGILKDIPRNWRDHLDVVHTNNRRLNKEVKDLDPIDLLFSRTRKVPLDKEHHRLLKWLDANVNLWWWDADKHMLVTHVHHLLDAYESLSLRGHFETMSRGKNLTEQNCFCFPMSNGAWVVRRFSKGVSEADSWCQDSAGWTRCILNATPTFDIACKTFGGLEDEKGNFKFQKASDAQKAVKLLGRYVKFNKDVKDREVVLTRKKDGKLVFSIDKKDTDSNLSGWLNTKKGWQQVVQVNEVVDTDTETSDVDDCIRHVVDQNGQDAGWVIQNEGRWNKECLNNVKFAIQSMGLNGKVMNNTLGAAVLNPWKLVVEPFKPEYPGDRKWNRDAPQFTVPPSQSEELNWPTWCKLMDHCGRGLDDAVLEDEWCQESKILKGGEYLIAWVASMLQEPYEPLPYLFIYSQEQNTGKSTFHEAISMLMTKQGYTDASAALMSNGDFNGELEGKVLCYIEEKSLSKKDAVMAKLKDWVTSRLMLIHAKRATPYMAPNITHWIHVANKHEACPVFDGDTRITMIQAHRLDNIVPKRELMRQLRKELADFLAYCLRYKVPKTNDRLRIPIVTTTIKTQTMSTNMNALDEFLSDKIERADGYAIPFAEFHKLFVESLDDSDRPTWTKRKVGKSVPPEFLKGKLTNPIQTAYLNVKWKDVATTIKVDGVYKVKSNGYAYVEAR